MLNAAVVECRDFTSSLIATAEPVTTHAQTARVALLGVGTVGTALLARLEALAGSPLTQRLQLVHIANSSASFSTSPFGRGRSEAPGEGQTESALRIPLTPTPLPQGEGLHLAISALGNHCKRMVIDATASETVAEHHAQWLAQGIHVVTACDRVDAVAAGLQFAQ